MTPALWTVVPMRGMASGKSRLAAVLDDAARARLNRWLLDHTLGEMRRWRGDLRHCIVVSPCGEALEVARRSGALAVCEQADANDLNRALVLGAAHAAANGADQVLILPCDLPRLTAEALESFAAAGVRPRHMVIAPDAAQAGTNALLVDAGPDIEFNFGSNSCSRHQAWAAARGWTVSICTRPELAFDLDTPEDLASWTTADPFRSDVKMTQPLQYERAASPTLNKEAGG